MRANGRSNIIAFSFSNLAPAHYTPMLTKGLAG